MHVAEDSVKPRKFITITKIIFFYHIFSKATPCKSANSYLWGRDEQHGNSAAAQHGEVQLSQMLVHSGSLLSDGRPRSQTRLLPGVSVARSFRNQHGAGVYAELLF